jgi:hypothetical protein
MKCRWKWVMGLGEVWNLVKKRVLSAGLGGDLTFGTMRQLVNEMSLEVGRGAGRSLKGLGGNLNFGTMRQLFRPSSPCLG